MRYGIDASNLVSGGGTNHLINLLAHINGVTDSTTTITVWASDKLRAEMSRTKAIDVITVPDINGSSFRRLFWQMRKLPYLAQDVCDSILVPGGIAGNHSYAWHTYLVQHPVPVGQHLVRCDNLKRSGSAQIRGPRGLEEERPTSLRMKENEFVQR